MSEALEFVNSADLRELRITVYGHEAHNPVIVLHETDQSEVNDLVSIVYGPKPDDQLAFHVNAYRAYRLALGHIGDATANMTINEGHIFTQEILASQAGHLRMARRIIRELGIANHKDLDELILSEDSLPWNFTD